MSTNPTHLTHLTQAGERWDLLAWHYYRDVRQMARLIEANPHAPATPVLPSGLRLMVPLLAPSVANNPHGVPPWRR